MYPAAPVSPPSPPTTSRFGRTLAAWAVGFAVLGAGLLGWPGLQNEASLLVEALVAFLLLDGDPAVLPEPPSFALLALVFVSVIVPVLFMAPRSKAIRWLAPLWLPFFLLRGLLRLCWNGLTFLLEAYGVTLGAGWERARPVVMPLAVLAFPLLVAAETAQSVLRHLGSAPMSWFGRRTPEPVAVILGVPIALLSPLWAPVLAVHWLAARVVGELVLPRIEAGDRVAGRGRFETFVALRYLRGRRSSAGVSVTTGLTMGGVAVGNWSLIVVLSVMAGFEVDLQKKILGTNAHAVVLSYTGRIEAWRAVLDEVRSVEGVTGATPFLYSETLIRSKGQQSGAVIKGIDAATVGEVTDVVRNITVGPQGRVTSREEAQALIEQLDALPPAGPAGLDSEDRSAAPVPGVVIGKEMAAALRVAVGDRLLVLSPTPDAGPMGAMSARMLELQVAGIFHSGMFEYDTKFAYVSLDTAGRLLRVSDAVTGIEVSVRDLDEAPQIAALIAARLRYPHWTRDWQTMNEPLFKALELEKIVMGIILTFIVAVAALNIVSMLAMLVIDKQREIAILKAMGAGRLALLRVFVIDGLVVGLIGTTLGLVLGLSTCAALARWRFIELSSDVYYLDRLPVNVSPPLVAVVVGVSVAISFLATLYPAWQASRLDPVEGLRDG